MSQQHINLGNYPNDPSADTMYVAFPKVEANFDDLYQGAAISNATLALVTAAGSTTARTLAARFADAINVLDFGATGNGTTDDTTAVQAAATAAAGKCLYFPAGTYLISASIIVQSNTLIYGAGSGSLLTASATWPAQTGDLNYMFFKNANYSASSITDDSITIENLSFSYVNYQNASGGGNHAIRFRKARNIIVRDCHFNYGNDAVAFLGCDNTLIEGCFAYNNNNCPYDHWDGPSNARVIGCFASGSLMVQMVNFNAFFTSGLTADGCIIDGCTFIYTGTGFTTLNLYTLDTAGVVQNVVVSNNKLTGTVIRGVGACKNIIVAHNLLINIGGNESAIAFFGDGVGVPSSISVIGNTIVNPTTGTGELAVIRVNGNGYVISGNSIIGNTYLSNNIDTGAFVGVVVGNDFSQGNPAVGNNTINAVSGTSNVEVPNKYFLGGLDTSGGPVGFTFQSDNHVVFKSTDGAGASKAIFDFYARNSTTYLNFSVPVSIPTLQITGTAYTAGAPAATGYISITDSTGTVRKVLCA